MDGGRLLLSLTLFSTKLGVLTKWAANVASAQRPNSRRYSTAESCLFLHFHDSNCAMFGAAPASLPVMRRQNRGLTCAHGAALKS